MDSTAAAFQPGRGFSRSNPMKDLIRKFYFLLSPTDRRHLLVLYVLTVLGSVLEAVGVGAIPAFIVLIDDTNTASKYGNVREFLRMNFGSGLDLFLWAAFGLMVLFIVKNAYLSLLSYAKTRFVHTRQIELSTRLFRA